MPAPLHTHLPPTTEVRAHKRISAGAPAPSARGNAAGRSMELSLVCNDGLWARRQGSEPYLMSEV